MTNLYKKAKLITSVIINSVYKFCLCFMEKNEYGNVLALDRHVNTYLELSEWMGN